VRARERCIVADKKITNTTNTVVLLCGNDAARSGEISDIRMLSRSYFSAEAKARDQGDICRRISFLALAISPIHNLQLERQFKVIQKRSRTASGAIYEEGISANYRLLIVLRAIVHPSH